MRTVAALTLLAAMRAGSVAQGPSTITANDAEHPATPAGPLCDGLCPEERGRPGAEVAVVTAGELRALVLPGLQEDFRRNVVDATRGDLFLVVSPVVTRGWHRDGTAWEAPRAPPATLRALEAALSPLGLVVGDDEEVLARYGRAHLGPGYRDCLRGIDTPCGPQTRLHLRLSVGLALLGAAEARRGDLYAWVVRTRPDFRFARPLLPEAVFHWPDAVLYREDFLACMPRAAASSLLRQAALARAWRVSMCYRRALREALLRLPEGRRPMDADSPHQREHCNQCLARIAGWKVYGRATCAPLRGPAHLAARPNETCPVGELVRVASREGEALRVASARACRNASEPCLRLKARRMRLYENPAVCYRLGPREPGPEAAGHRAANGSEAGPRGTA